jgi:hypothetical protein
MTTQAIAAELSGLLEKAAAEKRTARVLQDCAPIGHFIDVVMDTRP